MQNDVLTAQEFLQQLESGLSAMPEKERNIALSYYKNLLQTSNNEAETIAMLGTPANVATEVLTSYVRREATAPPVIKSNNNTKIVLLIVGTVLLGPAIFGIASGIFGLLIGFISAGFALITAGALNTVVAPYVLSQDFGFGLLVAGFGLVSLGLGILFAQLTIAIVKGLISLMKTLVRKVRHA